MKKDIPILFGLLLSFSSLAEDINKTQVEAMLKSMVAQGIIPQKEADRAKEKLLKMSDKEWQGINEQAQVMAERYKDKDVEVELSAPGALKNIDFDGEMFKNVQKTVRQQMENQDLDHQIITDTY